MVAQLTQMLVSLRLASEQQESHDSSSDEAG